MALFAVLLVALVAVCAAQEPLPSLQHDTDVVRRHNPRLFLVDVVQPPAPSADPLQTNEVDTDADLPRLVRVLVPVPDYRPRSAPESVDAASEGLTRLQPPAADQKAPTEDWGRQDAAQAASAPASIPAPAPSVDLLPPPTGQPDEWIKHLAAQPRADDGGEVKDIPPAVGLWELFEELKKVQAMADVKEPLTELAPPSQPDYWTQQPAESRVDGGDEAKERPAFVAEPATELVPPAPGQADLSEWTKAPALALALAPAKQLHDKDQPQVPEPATHLVPPVRDSYMPEKPSSGEAGPDEFLSLGAPPKEAASSTFDQDHSDSYLPEFGELKSLSEGPVADDFLSIGEPPKENEQPTTASSGKDSYVPDDQPATQDISTPTSTEKDSYMPEEKTSVEKDSYIPEDKPSREGSSSSDTLPVEGLSPPKEEAEHVHEHEVGHVHDEVHATTPKTTEQEDEDEDVDGDGVKTTESKDFRKKRHICKRCGGYGGGGGFPSVSVVINKQYGGGGGGGYCDVCGRPQPQPIYQPVPVYKPVPVPVYKPVPVPVYKEVPVYQPVCHTCNQPPPPCNSCGGGYPTGGGYPSGGGSQSFSQSSSSSSSSSYSNGWGKK